jgi:PLP dependent protein
MLSDSDFNRLVDNLGRVRQQIAAAASRAGRSAGEIRLIGVTKYVSSAVAQELARAGLLELGESRPQELWRKSAELTQPVQWHMIGHLQRNKIRRSLPPLAYLHSGDSVRLLEAVDAECALIGKQLPVLLEVNVSGDASKHGFQPEELEPALERIAKLPNLQVIGLMTMAALEGGIERARRNFAALRTLRDRVRASAPPNIGLAELSMGMSDDFEVAIEEGSTMVRVGSALFEGLDLTNF